MNTPEKYPKAMIMIHWLSVVLLIALFFIGKNMEEYEFNAENFNRYRLHALLGMLLFVLTLVRLYFKKTKLQPQSIEYYSAMHKSFVTGVLSMIYFFLLTVPVIGFVMVYQTGAFQYEWFGAEFPQTNFSEALAQIHEAFVFILLALAAIHVSGVFMYKFKTGENLIKRMCLLMK